MRGSCLGYLQTDITQNVVIGFCAANKGEAIRSYFLWQGL